MRLMRLMSLMKRLDVGAWERCKSCVMVKEERFPWNNASKSWADCTVLDSTAVSSVSPSEPAVDTQPVDQKQGQRPLLTSWAALALRLYCILLFRTVT